MRGRPQRLSRFPRNRLIEDDLARCRTSELDLLLALGEPTQETEAGDPVPRFWWDLEWPCGLLTSLQFEQLTELLTIKLDEPEVEHALHHLGIAVRDLHLLEEVAPDRFGRLVGSPPDRGWSVWRRDPDGSTAAVAAGLTERQAACRRDELAAAEPTAAFAVHRAPTPVAAPPAPDLGQDVGDDVGPAEAPASGTARDASGGVSSGEPTG